MSETLMNIFHVRQYIQKAPPNLSFQEISASEQLVRMLEDQRQKEFPSAFPSGEEAKLEGRKQGGD